MSGAGFCTKCGAPRAAGASFCTSCGAALAAALASKGAAGPASTGAGIAVVALLLAAGSVAAWFALREPVEVPRAVTGSPGAPPPGATAQEGLPQGHPSIELPKEVLDFLDGLAAESDKDPKNVEAAQKLVRARYRASVLNASYRASAAQALDRLLALDPTNAEGMRVSANLAYDAGDYPEAEKRFRAYLDKHPGDASAITDLGSVLLFQERTAEAEAAYRDAIAKDEKFLQAWFNLGIAQQKQGRKDEALVSLRRALSLAESPEQKKHVEASIAELEGRSPGPVASGAPAPPSSAPPTAAAPPGGMPMPPPAPDRDVTTNASSPLQRQAEKPLVTHPIVGPRVQAFEWTGPTTVRVKVADFPMDQMPPFAKAKFKSSMAEKLGAVAAQNGAAGPVVAEIVDAASGRVMDTVDTATAPAGSAAPSPNGTAAPTPKGAGAPAQGSAR